MYKQWGNLINDNWGRPQMTSWKGPSKNCSIKQGRKDWVQTQEEYSQGKS